MAFQDIPHFQSGPPGGIQLDELRLEDRTGEYDDEDYTECHDKRQILLQADEFVDEHALDDIRDQIRKAALLINDPDDLERVEGLTKDEIDALQGKNEKRSCCSRFLIQRWRLPTYLCHVGVLFSCAELFAMIGFATQSQVKISPGVRSPEISPTRPFIWFAIKFLGFWAALLSNRYFGRRRTLCFAVMAMIPGSYGASPDAITAIKSITGPIFAMAVGIFQCTVVPYLAELSPARQRGAVVACWILNQSLSILLIFNMFTVVGVVGMQIGTLVTTCCLLLCCWYSAESPYTSVRNGQAREAYRTLCRSRRHEIQAACDLYRMHSFYAHHQDSLGDKDSKIGRMSRLLIPSRGSLRAIGTLGVIIIAQIIPKVLMNYMKLTIDLGPADFALILLITLFLGIRPISLPLLDLIRRRKLVLSAMLVTPFIIFLECLGQRLHNLIVVLIAHLLLFVPVGIQTLVPVIYAAEAFPLEFRDVGMSIATSMLFASEITAKWLTNHFIQPEEGSSKKSYSLSALISLGLIQGVASIFIYLLMRETGRHELVDIGSVFETRIRDLVRYRIMIHLPYVFKRYFLWKRDVELCPFELSKYNLRYEGKLVLGEDMERLPAEP